MLDLLKDFIVKALGHLAPFAIRWFYQPDKLANAVKIRVRSEGDGITFNCGELPHIRIWLLITNLTPFKIDFDRIFGQVCYGAVIGEFVHLRKYSLPPSKEKEIFIEYTLNGQQVQYIRRNLGKMDTKIYLGAYVNSKIRNFELSREINTKNVQLQNCINL